MESVFAYSVLDPELSPFPQSDCDRTLAAPQELAQIGDLPGTASTILSLDTQRTPLSSSPLWQAPTGQTPENPRSFGSDKGRVPRHEGQARMFRRMPRMRED